MKKLIKLLSKSELLYDPQTESLTQEEISKYLDEFHPNVLKIPIAKSQK